MTSCRSLFLLPREEQMTEKRKIEFALSRFRAVFKELFSVRKTNTLISRCVRFSCFSTSIRKVTPFRSDVKNRSERSFLFLIEQKKKKKSETIHLPDKWQWHVNEHLIIGKISFFSIMEIKRNTRLFHFYHRIKKKLSSTFLFLLSPTSFFPFLLKESNCSRQNDFEQKKSMRSRRSQVNLKFVTTPLFIFDNLHSINICLLVGHNTPKD